MKIAELIALFFRLQVADAKLEPEPQPEPEAQPEPDQPGLELEAPDEPEPKVEPNEELETARRELAAEKERAVRFEREAADLRLRHAPKPSDDIEARENAKLADPETPALEKWQIDANRKLRQNTAASQMALAQAQDVRDQTAFAAIAMTDPVAKRYETKVEQELAKARAAGQNPTREGLYTYLLGKDMREGKFKKKAAPAAPGKTVERGKLPGARSDVNAKSGMSEREKRAARLANVPI